MIKISSENDLRYLLSEGLTLYQISRQFNTTIPEIFKLGRSYGISFDYYHNHIPKPTKQDLESMYNDEHLTQKQISREFGVTAQSVHRWLRDYDIPTRGGIGTLRVMVLPKDELYRMYVTESMTIKQIASKFNVSHGTVSRRLSDYNISTVGRKGSLVPIPPKEVLERMYIDECMTQEQIAKEFNVSQFTVHIRLSDYNISTVGRKGSLVPIPPKEVLLNYIADGLNQHQIAEKCEVCDALIFKWCEYYGIPGMVNNFRCTTPEHQEWRHAVFDRDHRTCQKCGATNTMMQAHHIVPYCDHPEIGYELENGITLCKQCHESIRGREYDYIQQFAAITQPHLRDHEVIESMPWEPHLPPLQPNSIIDYPQGVTA